MRRRGIEPRADAQSVLIPPRRRARRLARSPGRSTYSIIAAAVRRVAAARPAAALRVAPLIVPSRRARSSRR
eukprot:5630158-Prymnesium_polylepis.1